MAPGIAKPTEEPTADGTPVLLLGLFLLLLAFFIVLNALSSVEKNKARQVLESVGETFSRHRASPGLSARLGPRTGETHALEEIERIVATEIPLARIEKPGDGRMLRLTLPIDTLFRPDAAAFLDERSALLDRMAAILAAPPAGSRYDLEFLLGGDGAAFIADALAVGRAGLFARHLRRRGAPADRIAIGAAGGAEGEVVLRFLIRPVDEPRPNFSGASDVSGR
ncbi:MAG: flagellar motor protein MotB [Alphaproteobacteria bacterium]